MLTEAMRDPARSEKGGRAHSWSTRYERASLSLTEKGEPIVLDSTATNAATTDVAV